MFNILITLVLLITVGIFAFSKRLSSSTNWKATITPLASIMGSGFLVSAPLLAGAVGNFALISMLFLLIFAYSIGGAIRFNIRYFEPIEKSGHGPAQIIGTFSRVVLAAAYFISITYYLQLLAAFLLNAFDIKDPFYAHCVTSFLLALIGIIGIWRGLEMIEKVEKYIISLNLGMIAALLVGLLGYNIKLFSSGSWALPDISSQIRFHDARIILGLLIIVQGFETSRFLGESHPAEQRILTMRIAQLFSSAIYLVFIGLATVLFHDKLGSDVTAIINMSRPISYILPSLLLIAAVGSQLTAAIADNAGAGGLIVDISSKKLSIKHAYMFILFITIAITWATNVNSIIAYASRAFALFYMLQCLIATVVAAQLKDLSKRIPHIITFGFLAVLCLTVFVLGIPSK